MNSRARLALAVALLPLVAGALPSRSAEIPLNERRSAYEDMSRDNKAMQDDDTSNPGMLAVLDGEALWAAPAGALGKSGNLLVAKLDITKPADAESGVKAADRKSVV